MEYSPRFRLFPTTTQRESLDWTRDIVRQVYNNALHEFNKIPEDEGTLRQRVWQVRDELPQLKLQWTELKQVYSTVLQKAVERIRTNINNLGKLKSNGYDVGSLNWKSPREFRSFTYRQSGFELDKKSGPRDRAILRLKKVRGETLDIPIRLHRDLPNHDAIKEVTVKKEPTGAWYASFCISTEKPEKPDVEDIDTEDTVGLDLGVRNFIHDSEGRSIGRLDLSDERERLEREQRSLSRKQYESNNWKKQRRRVAEVHARMSNKKRDYKHKIAHFYATEYDAVFVENLDVRSMLESNGNARNKHEVGWSDFCQILEHHCDKHGTHYVEVPAQGTTKECASCGVKTEKPLWVREHSCPSCGFELDRDWNAALNVKSRGLEQLGVVHSEATSSESPCDSDGLRKSHSDFRTPAETATVLRTEGSDGPHENSVLVNAVDTRRVSASRVVETGSPCLKEAATAAE